MIPLILHQTWKTSPPPGGFAATWKQFNPDLRLRLYDDQDCRDFVAEEFPQFLTRYDSFPFAIQRADFFRYLIVFRCGGWYADLDMECLRPMQDLLHRGGAVFCVEAHLTPKRQEELGYCHPYQIANCIFASEAGHPFLQGLIEEVAARERAPILSDPKQVEDVAGPRMLTRFFYRQAAGPILVLPQTYWLPPRWYPNLFPLNQHLYARHHFWGTWKTASGLKPSLRRRWIERDRLPNPFPLSEGLHRLNRN